MAEWFAHYRDADGALLGITTNTIVPPAGETVTSLGDFPAPGNPWSGGQQWNPTTRALEARPPVVLRSRIAYDIQNNPFNWPQIDEYNNAVNAVANGSRRARIRTAVRAMMRRFLGDGRWRNDLEPGELEPDSGGED